jgi:hypothetical protein
MRLHLLQQNALISGLAAMANGLHLSMAIFALADFPDRLGRPATMRANHA